MDSASALLTASGHDAESDKKNALSFSAQTSLRAHSDCNLRTGLSDAEEVYNLWQRYANDFVMLKADRNRINGQRRREKRKWTFPIPIWSASKRQATKLSSQ